MHRSTLLYLLALSACGGPEAASDGSVGDGGSDAARDAGAFDAGPPVDAGPRPDAGPIDPGSLFPLHAQGGRLLDPMGRPFLMRGDSAWSLIAELSEADATRYLDDRAARGFNTLLVSLIEHKFTSHTPAWRNASGDVPFTDTSDFTTTVEAYFAHADWLIDQARLRGMLVLLVPSYMGYGCGDEGWCAEMMANGTTSLRAYGQFVGTRYNDVPNIVWVEGGDHTPATSGSPSERDLVDAIAQGIMTGDGGAHLHTAHWDSETAASDPSPSWLGLDSVYTYSTPHTYVETLRVAQQDQGTLPFFLIESSYENEHSTSRLELRAQMYHPMLSGGTGFDFGNFPIWALWSPGAPAWFLDDHGYPGGWSTALDTPGAHDATIAGDFFASTRWSELVPDRAHRIMTDGFGSDGDDQYVLCAATSDGRLAIAYYTGLLSPTVDLSRFAGALSASWLDPSNGATSSAGTMPASGTHVFTPSGSNSDGSDDWVLVLTVE